MERYSFQNFLKEVLRGKNETQKKSHEKKYFKNLNFFFMFEQSQKFIFVRTAKIIFSFLRAVGKNKKEKKRRKKS